jgi:hypothetical protein
VPPPSASSSPKSSSVPKRLRSQPKDLGLNDPAKGGTAILRNVGDYQSARRHIPEDLNLQQDFHYNLKPRKAHWIRLNPMKSSHN